MVKIFALVLAGVILTSCKKDLLSDYSKAESKIMFKKSYEVEDENGEAKLVIPPGTKDADKVEITPGTLVLDPATAGELDVDLDQASLGDPVHISGPDSVPEENLKSSTLSIKTDSSGASLSGFYFLIAYDAYIGGKRHVGLLTDVSYEAPAVYFSFKGFGNYQTIRLPNSVPKPASKEFKKEGKPISAEEQQSTPPIEVQKLFPLIAKAGEVITIQGAHFQPGITVAYRGKSFSPSSLQDGEIRVSLSDVKIGLAPLYISQNGLVKNLPLAFAGSAGDHPLSMLPPEKICSGEKFYDKNGNLQVGQKVCEVPPCTGDGQENCLVSGRFKAADTSGASEKILAGQTLAGVSGRVQSQSSSLGNCSSDGEINCQANASFPAVDLTNLGSKVVIGQSVAGVSGNVSLPSVGDVEEGVTYGAGGNQLTGTFRVPSTTSVGTGVNFGAGASEFTGTAPTESHTNCSSDGGIGCVTTSSYPAAVTSGLADKVLATQVVAGVTGTVTLPPVADVEAGVSFGVGGNGSTGTLVLPAVSDVRDSVAFGASGSEYTGTFTEPGVENVESGVTYGGGGSEFTGTFGVPGPADVESGVSFGGGGAEFIGTANIESHSDCISDGEIGCVTTSSFPAADISGASNILLSGGILAGISGNVTLPDAGSVLDSESFGVSGSQSGMIPTCSNNLQDDCYVDSISSFDAADLTNLQAGNIKKGVTIAGQTGDYPSSTYPLPGASGTPDLDYPTFMAKVKSGASFEYWSSDGYRHLNAGDPDITPTNIRHGQNVFGATGSWGPPPQSWDVRVGTVVNGVTGELKVNCRSMAVNNSIFNDNDTTPSNAGGTSGSSFQWWDIIDHHMNSSPDYPSSANTTLYPSWSEDHFCDSSNFADLTSDGSCESPSDDCIIKDKISNLMWTEPAPNSGGGPGSAGKKTWADSVSHCDNLSYGGFTDWRLPTRLELTSLYGHGIRDVFYKNDVTPSTARPGGDTLKNNDFFFKSFDHRDLWSATTYSPDTSFAYAVYMNFGEVFKSGGMATKTSSHYFLCVREP